VIWNEDDSVYRQTLQDAIVDLVASSRSALIDNPAGFLSAAANRCRTTIAICCRPWRIVLMDDGGTLAEQADRRGRTEVSIPQLKPLLGRPEPPIRYEPLLAIWRF
jgi:hypothetical protein